MGELLLNFVFCIAASRLHRLNKRRFVYLRDNDYIWN
jgi:hypothetical protein